LDTEFGDGARFLELWRQWRQAPGSGRMLHYVGLLPTGAPPQTPIGDVQSQALASAISRLDGREGFHRLLLDGGRVSLTLCLGDAHTSLAQQSLQADLVYLGSRWPLANTLASLAKCCKRGTRLQMRATFAAAARHAKDTDTNAVIQPEAPNDADAAQALKALGFRHSADLEWVFDPAWPVRRSRQAPRAVWTLAQRCTVIGAGISGSAVARALAVRGWQVRVLDAQAGPAAGASGVPAGLVSPVVSADDGPVSQLSRSGCALVRQHAQALLVCGQDWEPSGAWLKRAAPSPDPAIALDPNIAQSATPAQWLPEALWLRPAALVRAWLATPGVTFTGNSRVRRLERQGEDWVCLDENGQALARSPMVVIASALDAARLLRVADAEHPATATTLGDNPLEAVYEATPSLRDSRRPEITPALSQALAGLHPAYGGVSMGESAGVRLPTQPIQGHGNFLPSVPLGADGRGMWLAGASFEPQPHTNSQTAHRANLERLAQHLPEVAAALAPQFDGHQVDLWHGQRCVSHDRLPLVGAVQAAPHVSLWISAGMGARGLTLAALCAELLVARLHGEPMPLPARLGKLLDAQRLARRTQLRKQAQSAEVGLSPDAEGA
jgi:tRNA 5-methylaminomethyl-2-thiouridine biosynthesis bifunctional protein